MNVHGLTVDRGGCFYYRIRQPLADMRSRGNWTSWGNGIDAETFSRADVIVGQYLHLEETVQQWKTWRDAGDKLLVWEADDDITAVLENEAAGSAYRDPETVPRMLDMLSASHLCTVTTPALAEVYRPYQRNVAVLPNLVPQWLLDAPVPCRREGAPLRVGYTASKSHSEDFYWWSGIWSKWMAKNSYRAMLVLAGPGARPEGMPTTWRVESIRWRKDTQDYLRMLPGFADVGIAPLLDTKFSRGKSPIKALEYAAAGIPCIASDHPVYRNVVIPGVTGFLCRTQKDWLDALSLMVIDEELRRAMSVAAKEHARRFAMNSGYWLHEYYRTAEAEGIVVKGERVGCCRADSGGGRGRRGYGRCGTGGSSDGRGACAGGTRGS